MKNLLFIIALLCSTGCVSMDKYPGVHVAYAPMNESLDGQVSYRAGLSSIASKMRREEAYRQMSNACGGYYIITGETENRNTTAAVMNDGILLGGRIGRHYIQYKCVSPNAPPPPIITP